MSRIGVYDKWTNPRKAASAAADTRKTAAASGGMGELPHGMTATEIERLNAQFDKFLPMISNKSASANSFFNGLLPPDVDLAPNAGAGLRQATQQRKGNFPNGLQSDTSGAFTTTQTPYLPEFASPDRQSYPIHRVLANRYWRLF